MSLLDIARQAVRTRDPGVRSPELIEIQRWLVSIGEPNIDQWLARCATNPVARDDLLFCARNPLKH